ncbi:hypothetical protein OnM2_044061 [Erysiphe neolycopersici]|uniref:Uncharacterized protein n=1 Tax=Erysiphe neolycopersici TaxID=212602 RepID=A0A420HUJ3_9PEZI|nr:hypothetical protein OnM2_044061 [Erysiphe neolycopersici]
MTIYSRMQTMKQQGLSKRPTFPAAYKKELETAYELLLKADQNSRLTTPKPARLLIAEGINVDRWRAKISEKERLENVKATRKVERQIQIAVDKARKLFLATGVQSCGSSPPY